MNLKHVELTIELNTVTETKTQSKTLPNKALLKLNNHLEEII